MTDIKHVASQVENDVSKHEEFSVWRGDIIFFLLLTVGVGPNQNV